ncbi:MAG: hypothetical protein J7L38_08645 [Thermoproteales archaeon]|nr:hypothetical protein [Thermoproteales archaeon]
MPVEIKRLLPPDEWKKRQLGNLKAVGETNYKVGIAHPRKDPIAAAIAAEERYAEVMKKVIEEKRRKKGLEAVKTDEWYGYSETIGAPRLVDGVIKREAKVDRFINTWHPLLAAHVAEIDKMPDVTDRDREERMLANVRGLRALHGKWKKPA